MMALGMVETLRIELAMFYLQTFSAQSARRGLSDSLWWICFFKLFYFYLSTWLCWVLVAAGGIQFPDQGSNPGPPALGAQGPSHWTTRDIWSCLQVPLGKPVLLNFMRLSIIIASPSNPDPLKQIILRTTPTCPSVQWLIQKWASDSNSQSESFSGIV